MGRGIDFFSGAVAAKQYVSARMLEQAARYMSKNPETNVPKLLELAERVSLTKPQKEDIRSLRTTLAERPALQEFVSRLFRQVHPNVQHHLLVNFFVNNLLFGVPKQRRLAAELGVEVPNTILIDPTSACNLSCTGCWAGKYGPKDSLPFELVDRVIREAEEIGIHYIVMSGGEPTVYPDFFRIAEAHPRVAFMFYTNGTMIDERFADRLVELGNLSPAISIEGNEVRTDQRRGPGVYRRILRAMDLLRERGAVFGFSLTVNRLNAMEAFSDEFIDLMIEKGALYGWSFHYVPIGRDPDLSLMITPEQRAYLAERVPYVRAHRPIQLADFWNDGELTQGCIAGGRRYFHINAGGEVEPCAFVHFTIDNIREHSLKEIITSPFFRSFQKRQPVAENLLRPCPIIDRPTALREIVAESGARPTHEGAEAVLEPAVSEALDQKALAWQAAADPIWEARRLARDRSLGA